MATAVLAPPSCCDWRSPAPGKKRDMGTMEWPKALADRAPVPSRDLVNKAPPRRWKKGSEGPSAHAPSPSLLQGMEGCPEALLGQGVVMGLGCCQGLPQSPHQVCAPLVQPLSIKVQDRVIPESWQEVLHCIGIRHLAQDCSEPPGRQPRSEVGGKEVISKEGASLGEWQGTGTQGSPIAHASLSNWHTRLCVEGCSRHPSGPSGTFLSQGDS